MARCPHCKERARTRADIIHRPLCPRVGGVPGFNLVRAALVIREGGSVEDVQQALAGGVPRKEKD